MRLRVAERVGGFYRLLQISQTYAESEVLDFKLSPHLACKVPLMTEDKVIGQTFIFPKVCRLCDKHQR